MTRLMTCREFIEFLWRYLDGEVSAAERLEFEMHLAQCTSCAAYMESYLTTKRLERIAFEDPDAPVSDEVPDELVEAVLSAKRRGLNDL
jgi:anti-sigma factor RsiW